MLWIRIRFALRRSDKEPDPRWKWKARSRSRIQEALNPKHCVIIRTRTSCFFRYTYFWVKKIIYSIYKMTCVYSKVKFSTYNLQGKHVLDACLKFPRNVHAQKRTVPKILNKYSQKWNCAASFRISTFMYLWAIYLVPQIGPQTQNSKMADRSWEYKNRSLTHECIN